MELSRCKHCSELLEADKLFDFEGQDYCELCHQQLFTLCHTCGEEIEKANSQSYNFRFFCETCFEENHRTCDRCDDIFPQRDSYYAYNGDCLCVDCYENYFSSCDRCGEVFERNEMNWNDNDGCYYCGSCNYDDDEEIYHAEINSYSYKPVAILHKVAKEKTEMHFGFEYEIQVENGDCIDTLKQKDELYFKHDCSVGKGFEIVTHPMTKKYIEETGIINFVMDTLCDYNAQADYNTGNHIHFTRGILNECQEKKLAYFGSKFGSQLMAISKRNTSHCDYAKRYDFTMKNFLQNTIHETMGYDRSNLFNFTNRATIECRLFNGTVDATSAIENFEILCGIINYIQSTHIYDFCWSGYVKYMKNNYAIGYNFINKETTKRKELQCV